MALSVDSAFEYLAKAVSAGRLASAYLIAGPAGSGKEQVASRLVSLVNNVPLAGSLDAMVSDNVRLLRPESKSRRILVDQVRELESMLYHKVAAGNTKVGIITDADRLQEAAQNAFLKTLEEPPEGCLLLLITAFPEQLLDTVHSRCITVTLLDLENMRVGGKSGERIRGLLAGIGSGSGVSEALALARSFSEALKEIKKQAEDEGDAERKREAEIYSKTTDGSWLKGRDGYFKALSQSRYLARRAELLEILVAWFGDSLRQQSGYSRLDLPEDAAATQLLAKSISMAELNRRMAAVENLRDDLATNVQESLAIEVAFIAAFTAFD
jgi:DNA polymerase-3 subunit delta'